MLPVCGDELVILQLQIMRRFERVVGRLTKTPDFELVQLKESIMDVESGKRAQTYQLMHELFPMRRFRSTHQLIQFLESLEQVDRHLTAQFGFVGYSHDCFVSRTYLQVMQYDSEVGELAQVLLRYDTG